MLSWGRASPPPDPHPRALRAEMSLIRTLFSYWRAAVLGLGEVLSSLRKSYAFPREGNPLPDPPKSAARR